MTIPLMAHLVYQYPNPEVFKQALEFFLVKNVEFLEIQLPFSHPLADGPVIANANQEALKFYPKIRDLIEFCGNFKSELKSQTKLILMTYSTPISGYGFETVTRILSKNNFQGMIIPDLPVDSEEFVQTQKLLQKDGLYILPVISPLTKDHRLQEIKKVVGQNLPIYAVIRKGITGSKSDLNSPEVVDYLKNIKSIFSSNRIAVGFGIKEKTQVQELLKQDFLPIIGSEIQRLLNNTKNTSQTLQDLFQQLGL
jgi:tryptophan synthase alpha chain